MGNNFIYDKLVRDENDFPGLVAYGLYKRHKIEFIKQLKEEKHMKEVTDKDLEAFHLSSNSSSQLHSYQLQAENLLQKTFMATMENELDLAVQDMHADYQSEIKNALPKWWHNVLLSVISSIIASAITALVFMFVSFKIDFDDKVDQIHKSEQHIEQMVSSMERTGNH